MKAPKDLPQLVGLTTAAEALSMDERTVRKLIGSQGRERLVAAKLGGRWKIRVSEIEAYIDRHTRKSA